MRSPARLVRDWRSIGLAVLAGIGSRRCVSENSDNTHYVKLLTLGDTFPRCGRDLNGTLNSHLSANSLRNREGSTRSPFQLRILASPIVRLIRDTASHAQAPPFMGSAAYCTHSRATENNLPSPPATHVYLKIGGLFP